MQSTVERDSVIGRVVGMKKGGVVVHAVTGNDEGNVGPRLIRRRDLSMEGAFRILEFYRDK